MPATNNSEAEFEALVQSGVTLVDFSAPWCDPCQVQKPITKQIGRQFNGRAKVVGINVDKSQQPALRLGVTSIPTLIVFKNGKELERFVGIQAAAVLSQAIQKALA